MSDDHQRQLPLPRPNLLSNEYRNGKTRHEKLPKVPSRAIAAKADALRSAVRNGNPLDSAELQERYVDLWHEARLAIWRAKHSKAGIKQHDEITDQDVLTFVVDEKQVLAAIDTTRSVLDSLV